MTDPTTTNELREAFQRLRANRWKLARSGAEERIARLQRLRAAIWARREALQQAIQADFGKHPTETDITEIFPTLSELQHTCKHLAGWMKPARVGRPWALLGTKSQIRHEALGLVLVLSPWNYPVNLLLTPLIAAIAAGNAVAVKPSSKVPATARCLQGLLSEVFPADEVAVFLGDSGVADALLELPFDHVFFTGSPRVGRSVMTAAARHLASVTLELGGKSPVIVERTADVALAAERVMWGKFINAGQTCVAPDYALVDEGLREGFVAACRRVLEARYGATEEARLASPFLSRLVSSQHASGLRRLLADSVAAGAKVELGGSFSADGRGLSPTLLTGVRPDSPAMRSEIFGPILPILGYTELEEALALVRAKDKPLALYVFSRDEAAVEHILGSTTAGGSCVNTVIAHLANPDLPFGGVGTSGQGSYHGVHGFRALSHARAVLRQKRFDGLRRFYPPYTGEVQKLVERALRYFG
ncbi:MAG TPA: aldehyde dehydrogenase family protein [Myxococcota bacterium]|nr:aldehyde dehydrogenase family protein [Myxococcota bacterium]HRY96047.1 aldehyde dehydrogenase family protein [Myxococcota bacterium]HSA21855.1 aldehyde dehydrogenase family protein [Myxococcota bacterium]